MRLNLAFPLRIATLAAGLLLGGTLPAPSQTAAPAAADASTALARRIDAIVDRVPQRRAHWGIVVRDAHSGHLLYSRNAARHFVPASNLKLVVATAAAHLLGPDFRYRTVVYGTGPVRDGVLQGELVLRGGGDPTLSGRYAPSVTAVFEAWADSLAARGVRRVQGRVVADQSAWDTAYVRPDWELYDLRWWYAAPTGALGFNDNSIDFRIAPGRVGEPARITGSPASSFFSLDNRTRTVPAGRPTTLDLDREPGTNRIRAYGRIAADAGPRTEHFAVVDPARYTATVLREVLERRGIRFGQPGVRVVSDSAAAPPRGPVRFEHRSPPLPQIIGPILRNSQNWFADQLLKTVALETRGEGSWEAGLAAEREFLVRRVGIDSAAFELRDGSGLSAGNLVTPEALAELLAFLGTTPEGAMVREALPAAGQPGSLRDRLPELRGRVRAKTGYINNVDSLSGFLTTDDGRELIFVILANNSGLPSSRMKGAIDDVVRAIATAER